jgi:hypothetical protein
MKRGQILTGLLLILLALLAVYIARNSYWIQVTEDSPPKGEALRNPFYVIQRFAENLGARTEWRRGLVALPPTDGVIVLSGWHWNLLPRRQEALKRWVQDGGRLIADSSLIAGDDDLTTWAGITRAEIHPSDSADEPKPSALRTLVRGKSCRKATVTNSTANDGTSPQTFMVCTLDVRNYFVTQQQPTWAVTDDWGTYAARVPIGRGSFTLLSGAPFQFLATFDGDHAQLFVAAAQLHKGDRVYFISDNEFDSLLLLMWRYGAPVIALALALVALALWRGSARFGPLAATPDVARRSLGEQIRGTGWFTVRHGGGSALRAASVRALFETARRRIVNFDSLPADARVNALAKVSEIDANALAEAINFSGPRRPGDLRDTIALLETARRKILNRTGSPSRP